MRARNRGSQKGELSPRADNEARPARSEVLEVKAVEVLAHREETPGAL